MRLFKCPQNLDRSPYWAKELGLLLWDLLGLFLEEACLAWVVLLVASHSYRWHSFTSGKRKPPYNKVSSAGEGK